MEYKVNDNYGAYQTQRMCALYRSGGIFHGQQADWNDVFQLEMAWKKIDLQGWVIDTINNSAEELFWMCGIIPVRDNGRLKVCFCLPGCENMVPSEYHYLFDQAREIELAIHPEWKEEVA